MLARMAAAAFAALIVALVAMLVRLVAAAPLFATLGACFGNWAEESRSRHSRARRVRGSSRRLARPSAQPSIQPGGAVPAGTGSGGRSG